MKRIVVILGLITVVFVIIFIYVSNDNKVIVLTYHSILPNKYNSNHNSTMVKDLDRFEKEIKFLNKYNYESMSMEEFSLWKKGKGKKRHKSVLITFDDGYMDNYVYALPILKKYDMKATIFVVGSNVNSGNEGYLDVNTINKIYKEYPNIEIGSHSYDLHEVKNYNYDIVDSDIKKMNNVIDTKYYAYPHGEYNKEYIDALKYNNYDIAFTFGPGKEHRKASKDDNNYMVPRVNVSDNISFFKFIMRVILP